MARCMSLDLYKYEVLTHRNNIIQQLVQYQHPESNSTTPIHFSPNHSFNQYSLSFDQIMQYITIISALFAAVAITQPTSAPASRVIAARGITDLKDAAKSLLDSKSDGGCEVLSKSSSLCSIIYN